MTITAYPLTWPSDWKRCASRVRAKFHKGDNRPLSLFDGLERVLTELERIGIDKQDVIVSTGVRTRLDGMPRSGEPEPKDPGAAVYWQDSKGNKRVMAVDMYDRVADNLAAIAATLDALRAIKRHGGAAILDRAFTGFTALPAPTASGWRTVLGFVGDTHDLRDTPGALRDLYRTAAAGAHPDKPGGSHDAMTAVNAAYEQAKKELGFEP